MARVIFALFLCAGLVSSVLADPVWIDVRSAEEYQAAHIEGDPNLPFQTIATSITPVIADRNADIRVYCAKGARAEKAKNTLEDLGYTHVTNAGGIDDVRRTRGFKTPRESI